MLRQSLSYAVRFALNGRSQRGETLVVDDKCLSSCYPQFRVMGISRIVRQHLRGEFLKLMSYKRFVLLMPTVLGPLSASWKSLLARSNRISFIDSAALFVIPSHASSQGLCRCGSGRQGFDGLVL
jgi:hypothetical protein